MSDRCEARLLLAILAGRWDEAGRLVARRSPDPGRFIALAVECDVHPTVHVRLARAGRLDLVGPEAADRLEEMRRRCRNDNLILLARLEQALDRLLAGGIVPVALKGVDFLHRFYDGFDERTLDDVDLLVRPREFERALELLAAAGWRLPPEPKRTHWLRSSFEMPVESPGPVAVDFEIHWGLAQERRYRVDVEEVLARAVACEVAGRRILRLEDHDAAAHLLLHHLQHYFDRRLKWALDLECLAATPGFSWERVAARLDAWGGRAAAGLSLVHLAKLLPGVVPEEARSRLPASAWRRGITLPLRSSHPLDLYRGTRRRWVQLWLAAAALERPRDLPGYLLHRATRDTAGGGAGPDGGRVT